MATIKEIAELHGVSRECVRLWAVKKLAKFKRPGHEYQLAYNCKRPTKMKPGPKVKHHA